MPDEDEYTVYQTDDGVPHGYGEIVLITDSREQLAQSVAAAALAGYTIKEVENTHALISWFQSLQAGPGAGNAPAPPLPKPTVAAPAPSEAKPVAGETAQTLAAPDIKTASDADATALVDHVASDTRVSPIDAPDVYASRSAPRPADEIADMLVPAPATQDEYRAAITSTEHNFAAVPGERHPTHGAPFARAPATAGEPVDLFTGAMTIDVTDLIVPAATIPIRFQRSYRSGRPYFGPFGYGWDHNHNLYLRELNDGAVALWTGQLHEQTFAPDADSWKPEDGLAARLERAPDAPETFDIVHPGGTRWRFARPPSWGSPERIPLTQIADRHGNLVTFTYNSSDRLESVLDEAGRGLEFTYGSCGLLEAVSDHTKTRVVTYEHHEEIEHLVRVVLPATAEFPNGVPTTYDYDLYADHPAMRHNILRIADAQGHTYLENEYAGPEAGWAFNTVARQLAGGFEYRFDFEQIQFVAPDAANLGALATRTCVAPPDGSLHVYTFNYRGDLLDQRYRLVRDGSNRVVATQFAYDTQGNLTEMIAPDGLRQLMTFDATNSDPCARRNLLRVEIAAPLANLVPSRVLQRTEYDPTYQLPVAATGEAGEVTRYVYDFDLGIPNASGLLSRVEFPKVTLPDGSSQQSITHFEHNARGQVTAVVSPGGSRTTTEYMSGGFRDGLPARIIRDALAAALTTEFEYDSTGHPLRITAAGGHATTLGYNAIGQLEVLTPPAVGGPAHPIRTWYGDDGSPVRVERPRGNYSNPVLGEPFLSDTFERDALGRMTAAHLAANTDRPRSWRQRVDYEGRPTRVTNPTGTLTEHRFDERGRLLRETRAPGTPDEAISRYDYDRAGRLTLIEDASGWKTTIHPDLWGRVRSVLLPGGAIRANTWGPGDLLLETTSAGSPGPGQAVQPLTRQTYEYDQRGRLTAATVYSAVSDPTAGLALTTHYTYDLDDRIHRVEFPRGSTITFEYDGLGRPAIETDEHGTTREWVYDATGDIHTETVTETEGGALRRVSSTFEHDARGRLAAVHGPSGTTEFDYDDRDALIECREPGGVTSRFTTSPFGEVTDAVLDPTGLNIHSRWSFDDGGRLSAFIDPTSAATTWEYDHLGRVSRRILPGGSTWRYEYDLAARWVEETMPSGTRLRRTLNARGQPVKLECAAAAGVEPVPDHGFDYDALGRLVRAALPGKVIECSYDSLGRLLQETSLGLAIQLSYNDLNGDTDLHFPDGRRERTHHDPSGRPSRLTLETPGAVFGGVAGTELVAIDYEGHPTRLTHANGVETTLIYDRPGRLVGIDVHRGAELLDGDRARYDERDRRALVQQIGDPARNAMHGFDARDRLIVARSGFALPPLPDVTSEADHATAISAGSVAAAGATRTEIYVLDGADDRTRITRSALGAAPVVETHLLGPDHRILTAGANSMSYYGDGQRASDARRHYDIDALGRVVRVRDASTGATLADFTYDALSRATTGSIAGQAFARAFVGTTWIHETLGGELTRQATPHPLWPQPLQVSSATGIYVSHPDQGLSTLCVTDAAGALRERHRYGPFGEPELFGGDGVTPLTPGSSAVEPRWRAMPFNSALGLYESEHRLFDPDLGVFLAPDPLLYIDSPSRWAYAKHNPVDYSDPSGLAKSPLGLHTQEANASMSSEAIGRRSSELDRAIDQVNYDNAAAQFALQNGGLIGIPSFDPEEFESDVAAAFEAHEAGRIIDAGIKSAAAEEAVRRQEDAQIESEMPGTALGLTPGIGNALEAKVYLRHGKYTQATVYAAMAVSDVALVKSIGLGVGKLVVKLGAEELPVIAIRFTGRAVVSPADSVFLAKNLEMAQDHLGYLIRGKRLATDAAYRKAARKSMLNAGMDLTRLDAMHPLDSVAAGAYLKEGQGTTFYLGNKYVNRNIGAQLIRGLEAAGVKVGERFRVELIGFPEIPSVAPPASLPNLAIRYK